MLNTMKIILIFYIKFSLKKKEIEKEILSQGTSW